MGVTLSGAKGLLVNVEMLRSPLSMTGPIAFTVSQHERPVSRMLTPWRRDFSRSSGYGPLKRRFQEW